VEPYPEIEVEDVIPAEVLKLTVKKGICDMLKNYQLRRTDFFISNFIAWFKDKYKEIESNISKNENENVKIEEYFNDLIEKDIINQLVPHVRQILNNPNNPDNNKDFKIFCDTKEEEEIPDVAVLLGGLTEKSVK